MAAAGATGCRHLPDGSQLVSSEAKNVLHQAMRPALHHRIRTAIKIASVWCVFFVDNNFVE